MVNTEIAKINSQIESYLIDKQIKENFNISLLDYSLKKSDADICLSFNFQNQSVATAGISYGLNNYFPNLSLQEEVYFSFEELVKAANGKWGVTLMQSAKGKKELRELLKEQKTDYRLELMVKWEDISAKLNLPISFYLPGKSNYWNLDVIRDCNCAGNPLESVLRKNYDWVAKRFGFKFNKETSLFER